MSGSPRSPDRPPAPRRDRDAAGRARNARPRDAAGRPLVRGAPGIARVPDDLALPPSEALREAQRLISAGQPFAAHDVLEAVWKATSGSSRPLWRALAQLAVGLTHLQRGNRVGAVALLRRGGAGLLDHERACAAYGVDAADLATRAGALADAVENDPERLPAPTWRLVDP
jgi:hypothetical protein